MILFPSSQLKLWNVWLHLFLLLPVCGWKATADLVPVLYRYKVSQMPQSWTFLPALRLLSEREVVLLHFWRRVQKSGRATNCRSNCQNSADKIRDSFTALPVSGLKRFQKQIRCHVNMNVCNKVAILCPLDTKHHPTRTSPTSGSVYWFGGRSEFWLL